MKYDKQAIDKESSLESNLLGKRSLFSKHKYDPEQQGRSLLILEHELKPIALLPIFNKASENKLIESIP